MDRIKDNISLDHLSRLLVDVHIDSSTIVDSTISAYQRRLLNLIFNGDAESRDKVPPGLVACSSRALLAGLSLYNEPPCAPLPLRFACKPGCLRGLCSPPPSTPRLFPFTAQMNLVIANEITPHLTAEEYLDKGDNENELKQVLGDTRAAFDISEHDTLIFGAHGILVAGPNSRHHEPLLCSYLQVQLPPAPADACKLHPALTLTSPLSSASVLGDCSVRTPTLASARRAWLTCGGAVCCTLGFLVFVAGQFTAMDMFVRNFFNRMFLLLDSMKEV
jgi:hypothetical protein